MKFAHQHKESSFYESFCDLVLGVLVLMIVLVAALAAKAKRSTASVETEVQKLVYSNRFSGGSGKTTLYLGYVDVGGVNHVLFFPADIGASWNLSRNETHPSPSLINDPILRICERVQEKEDGMDAMLLPVSEFLKFDGGFNFACVSDTAVFPEFGMAITRLRVIREMNRSGFASTPAAELKRRIGGVEMTDDKLEAAVLTASRTYEYWVGTGFLPMHEGDVALATKLQPSYKSGPAVVQLKEAPNHNLMIGSAVVTPAQVRAILRAFRPGQGFYLEFKTASGQTDEPPPWVLKEVLEPVGYNTRIINEDRFNELKG